MPLKSNSLIILTGRIVHELEGWCLETCVSDQGNAEEIDSKRNRIQQSRLIEMKIVWFAFQCLKYQTFTLIKASV